MSFFLEVAWTDWSNWNHNGIDLNPVSCLNYGAVTGVRWAYRGDYGLIDVEIECSDGSTHRITNDNSGYWEHWMLPCSSDGGFHTIGVEYQDDVGIVNARTECGMSNGNENGNWETNMNCFGSQKFFGIQVNYQDCCGIVNVRIQCVSS